MAYLTVTTQFDVVAPGDGKLSLREALATANGSGDPDTIHFSATPATAGDRVMNQTTTPNSN